MKIDQFLSPADVLVGVRAADKQSLLRDLAARAASAVGMPNEIVLEELMKREALGSTGLGDGVALPHTRLPGLRKPFGCLAQLKRGIDFNAVDAKPVDIVFLLLMPADVQGDQLQALAGVSRRLRDKEVRHRLRAASDQASLHRVFVAEDLAGSAQKRPNTEQQGG